MAGARTSDGDGMTGEEGSGGLEKNERKVRVIGSIWPHGNGLGLVQAMDLGRPIR